MGVAFLVQVWIGEFLMRMNLHGIASISKTALVFSLMAATPLLVATPQGAARAEDARLSPAEAQNLGGPRAMPALGSGEYGTDVDNENNAKTGTPDGDMDVYLFRNNTKAPIEFNIILPSSAAGKSGTLRLDVYDVDATCSTPPCEVDKVYLNGTQIGVLNGQNNASGVNIFNIPPGLLKAGKNLVKVDIDTLNAGWAVEIDWGIIKLAGTTSTTLDITRAWVAPVRQKAGNFVNFFAELSGKVDKVEVVINNQTIQLTDPDGDRTWSGQWKIPTNLGGRSLPFTMRAIKGGSVVSQWPRLRVTR